MVNQMGCLANRLCNVRLKLNATTDSSMSLHYQITKTFSLRGRWIAGDEKRKSVQRQQCPALTAMAMTTKPLIIRLLLVVTVAMRMPLSVADPYNIASSHCGNISYSNGSAFQSNLNKVLERLVQNVYYSALNTSSAGDEGSDSSVYGLVQCIGGLDPYDCQQCASKAKTTLVQGCNGTSGDRISGTKEVILSRTIINPELIFKYDILREATCNFKMENKLGEGGFGCVFKGVLPNGREVAVKRLNLGSRQGDAEFLNEANLISRVQHRNLVKLLGCSVESSERLLVYEYLPISSLDKLLFDKTKRHILDWKGRYKIIVGIAHGLAYLHEESEIRIIHRDIKASNILLDHKHRPKIADFGLARLFAEDQTHVSTRVAGTLGYMAPEYALRGQLTEKADVFSFGVLLFEIISGRKNQSSAEDMEFLIEKTWRLYKAQRALEVMDPTLEGSYSWEEGIRVIKIGLLCTQAAAALRPSMSRVVWMLTSDGEHLLSPTKPAFIDMESLDAPDLTPPDVHSAAAAPSSSVMEPR